MRIQDDTLEDAVSLTVNELPFAELLLKPVVSQIRRDAETLAASLSSLLDIAGQFAIADDLIPAECDQAVLAVNALGQPARSLRRTLKQPGPLPQALVPHRFDLLASLCYIESKSDEVAAEIIRFRAVCRDSHPQITRQRMAIHRRVEALIQTSDRLFNQIIPLLGPPPSVTTHLVRSS
jgi:hypothetical protein